jgi:PAS domain S-box-containing protein
MNDGVGAMEMRGRMLYQLLVGISAFGLVLVGFLLLSSYREQVRVAERGARNLAEILQAQLHDALHRTDAQLIALASVVPMEALNRTTVQKYQHDIGSDPVNHLGSAERRNGLQGYDAYGVALYSLENVPAQVLSSVDSDFFSGLRDDSSGGLSFSKVANVRLAGKQILFAARPIRNVEGEFVAAALSPFDLELSKAQLGSLQIGNNGFVALRRRDDHSLVLSWPDVRDENNNSLAANHPLVSTVAGEAMDAFVLDGSGVYPGSENYITSVRTVANYPFYFVVGFDRESVLAGWHSQALIACAAIFALAGMGGVFLSRLGSKRARAGAILSALTPSEMGFRDLLQRVPVGISRFDQAGKCTFVNDRNLQITGWGPEYLVGNDWLEIIHPNDRKRVGELWFGKKGERDRRVIEYRLVRPDGETVNIIGDVAAERSPDGTVTGCIVTQTDVTPLKVAESGLIGEKNEEAGRANLREGRFLTAASHDLRQPIQAISLFMDAFSRTDLNEEQKRIVCSLSLSVRSLTEMSFSLLDLVKLDAGLIRPQMTRVEVEDIFRAFDEEFSSLAQRRNLRFKFSYPLRAPALRTDIGLLLSVLRRLIGNAFNHTVTGGVLVGFRRRGEFGIFQVWDTGVGIDSAVGERIFEEGTRVGNSIGNRAKGMGIGLSIARRTARLLGGDVVYRSKIGKGSVFEIAIPVDVGMSESLMTTVETGGSFASKIDLGRFRNWRVIVVEDDPVLALSIQLSLEPTGMQVQVFSSAEEAIASSSLLEGNFYIADLVLPGMNGIQLLDLIQSRSPAPIKAIVMTGDAALDCVGLTQAPVWRILSKPAGLATLLSTMCDIIDAHSEDVSMAAKVLDELPE